MNKIILALLATLLAGGSALAQPVAAPAIPLRLLGQPNGAAKLDSTGALPMAQLPAAANPANITITGGTINGVTQLNTTQTVTNPAGEPVSNTFNYNVTVTGANTAIPEGLQVNLTTSGGGSINSPGHAVAVQVQNVDSLPGYQQQAIAVEGIVALTSATGEMQVAQPFLAKLAGNAGRIDTFAGYDFQVFNSGVIGNYYGVFCELPTGSGTITHDYCIYNGDSQQAIYSAAPYINSMGQELAPAAASVPATGRYYFGVNHAAPASIFGNLNTVIAWAPFLMPGRAAFNDIGIHIATASAGATCQVAIYNSYNGHATGSPILGPYTVSAATVGDIEAQPGNLSLDAGLYNFGVGCSNNSVVITAYVEGAASAIYGAGTSAGNDYVPVTYATTFGASPAVSFNSGNVMPEIWLRR